MKNKIDTFLDKKFQQKLWSLALPIAFQSLLYSLLGLIDILMISQLGENEIAAVGLGNKIFFFNLIVIIGVAQAGGVLGAQYFGSKDLSGLRRALILSTLFTLIVTIPFIIFYTISPQTVTQLASSDINLLIPANEYLQITAVSLIFIAIVVPIETALRSSGDTKTTMRINMLALPMNAFFNYLLIFGHAGFPEMGVAGSALGTLLARGLNMIILLIFVSKKRTFIIVKLSEIPLALSRTEVVRYLKLMIPMVLQDGAWSFGVLVYTLIFAMIGVQELAVMSMVSTIESTIFALFIGVAIASSTMIGHELGAKSFNRAWDQAWVFLFFVPSIALIFMPIIILSRDAILTLFPAFSTSAASMAKEVLLILALALSIRVINFIGTMGVLRSGGDVKYSTFVNIFSMWGIGIPLTFIAVKYWGVTLAQAYFIALSEELLKVILILHRVHKKHWLKNLLS